MPLLTVENGQIGGRLPVKDRKSVSNLWVTAEDSSPRALNAAPAQQWGCDSKNPISFLNRL